MFKYKNRRNEIERPAENESAAMSQVQVVLRPRPVGSSDDGSGSALKVEDRVITLPAVGKSRAAHQFEFDHVYDESTSQKQLFEVSAAAAPHA